MTAEQVLRTAAEKLRAAQIENASLTHLVLLKISPGFRAQK